MDEHQPNNGEEDWNIDTVRTNAGKYNEENVLMNSPTAMRAVIHSNDSIKDEKQEF